MARPSRKSLDHGFEDAIRHIVGSKVAGYAGTLGVEGARPRPQAVRRFRHSAMVLIEFGGDASHPGIAVKFHLGPNSAAAAADEFRHLSSLHERLGSGSPARVPRPLDHLPDFHAVVMERICAPRLDETVRREARWWRPAGTLRAVRQCRQAAQWLRRLEETWPPSSNGPARACYQAARVTELERMVRDATAAVLSPSTAEMLRQGLANRGATPEEAIFKIHSDFAPYNAFGDGHVLYMTDFAEMPLGVSPECAGFFWAALEIAKLNPRTSRDVLTRCQDGFEEELEGRIPAHWKVWGMLRHLSYFPRRRSCSRPRAAWYRWLAYRVERWLRANGPTVGGTL